MMSLLIAHLLSPLRLQVQPQRDAEGERASTPQTLNLKTKSEYRSSTLEPFKAPLAELPKTPALTVKTLLKPEPPPCSCIRSLLGNIIGVTPFRVLMTLYYNLLTKSPGPPSNPARTSNRVCRLGLTMPSMP